MILGPKSANSTSLKSRFLPSFPGKYPWSASTTSDPGRMITKNEINYIILFLLVILEDLQLSFFSWRSELFSDDSNFKVIQYIFNPVFWVSKNLTPVAYIVSFGLFVLLAIILAYCTNGLVKGRMKVVWPLQILRILTVLVATVLYTPIAEALAQPLTCTDGFVTGFKDSVKCDDGVRFALYAASGIGALFLFGFSSLMASMYFEPSPRSKVGKASGRIDFFYVLARTILVITNILVAPQGSTIICAIVLGLLALVMLFQQPFYESILNRVRFSLFFSAFAISLCSIGGAFADVKNAGSSAQTTFGIAQLIIGFIAIPGGYFLNVWFTKNTLNATFRKLQDELEFQKQNKLNDVRVHKSQLELIYTNMDEVLAARAKDHEVLVFPDSFYAEVSARFIRESYLNDQAVTLVLNLFETAFEQYPKSAHLHLMYLQYIKEFLPQVSHHKNKHISFLNRRCSYASSFKYLPTLIPLG